MKDCHGLYLKCNVLLLVEVFEKFRDNSSKNYGLRPGHYLTEPALNWDAVLNMKKVELELIPDPDRYIFFQKGRRGCDSYISNNIVKPIISIWNLMIQKKNQNIIYLDTNNAISKLCDIYVSSNKQL